MKKALAIAGILALSITPTASFADHLEPKESEIRAGGNLSHTNLRGRNLSNASLFRADLSGADLSGANLLKADLREAELISVKYDENTIWPNGFDPVKAGAILKEDM